ncbi:MAG: hypothetical protein GY909_14570 [Oligoflexia bacterium]|nr:hypothetical protein [Oligoflexia bacterium]
MELNTEISLEDNFDVLNYLVKAKLFSSKLNVKSTENKFTIKNVNLFSKDIALIPEGDLAEKISFPEGDAVEIDNDRQNIKFSTIVKKIHGGKMIILEIPRRILINNERASTRFKINNNFKDEVFIKGTDFGSNDKFGAELMDISESGVALKLSSSYRFKKNDVLQLTVGSDYTFMNSIRSKIVYIKSVLDNQGQSFVKMALSFDNHIPKARLEKALPLL